MSITTRVFAGTAKRVGGGSFRPGSSCGVTRSEPRCDSRSLSRDADAARLLPRDPLGGQPVRAGDIGQRALVVGHVGQEQPRLQRRMEGVGVKLELRVGAPVGVAAEMVWT